MRMTNRSIFTIAAGVALVLAAMIGSITSTDAHADDRAPDFTTAAYASQTTFRLTAPTRHVRELVLIEAHRLRMGRLSATFNDGATYDVRACRYEDGHRCWWDAARVGNHVGTPFVSLRGRTWRP